tara:strand:- start:264 stop:452 length:189 start_codon:yes stop_codon:yes gene_type:complete
MKIIKLSDKKFNKLEEFIEKECDYILDKASEYIDSEIGNELIENNKPLFDLQKTLSEVKNNG